MTGRLPRTWACLLLLALPTVATGGPVSFGYDANGNLVSRTASGVTTEFIYDSRDRLVEVRREGAILVRYQHDARGRVAKKIGGQGIRQYVYDGDSIRVIGEYDENGTLVARYTWDDQRLSSIVRPGQTLVPVFDGLGSVVALTSATGEVVARYHYDAWGNYRFPDEATAEANRYGFTGHRWEPEIALYNANSRNYIPTLGRFASQDSYLGQPEVPASLHRYLYAHDNPTKYVDPLGHDVRLANDTPESRRKAFDTITKNLTVPEQRNLAYHKTESGTYDLYFKDSSKIDTSTSSPGYRYLSTLVGDERLKVDYVVIEERRSYTARDGETYSFRDMSGRNSTADGGYLGGGLNIYTGRGKIDVLVPEGGYLPGTQGLTQSGKDVRVAQPDYIIGAHELLAESYKYTRGNEHLQRDPIADSDKVIAIENEIRSFHGLPLRSGKGHGPIREQVTVTAEPPKAEKEKKPDPKQE